MTITSEICSIQPLLRVCPHCCHFIFQIDIGIIYEQHPYFAHELEIALERAILDQNKNFRAKSDTSEPLASQPHVNVR